MVPRVSVIRTLVVMAIVLSVVASAHGPVFVEAAPGDIVWARSELIGSEGPDAASGVAVDGSGVYVVGRNMSGGAGTYEWRVEKRSLTTGGIVWSQSESLSGHDSASGVAVDTTGLYVVGTDMNTVGHWEEWRVEKRSLTDGSLIWYQSEHISGKWDAASDVTVDDSGVYVVGYDEKTVGGYDLEWRIEKRSLTDGSLVWFKSEDISSNDDIASGVAVDDSGVYVVGADANTLGGLNEWRVEKRNLMTGDIIWSRSEHISTSNDAAADVAVDSSGAYVVGKDMNTPGSDEEWRVEKRNLGSPLPALAVSPQTPANATLIDSAYQTFMVRVTSSSAGTPVTGANVTVYVNGMAICTNKLAPATGLVSCSYQVTASGTYYWNGTAKKLGTLKPAATPQPTFSFTAGMIQAISLVPGWNMFSLPLVPANTLTTKVLAAQIAANDFSAVWSYQAGAWKLFRPTGASTLTAMPDGLGYWIHMTQSDTLYVTGWVISPAATPPTYSLITGWNLVGFKPQPTVGNETVGTYLSSIKGSYDLGNIWVYNNSDGTWTRATSATWLKPGDGMWVLMTEPATLKP